MQRAFMQCFSPLFHLEWVCSAINKIERVRGVGVCGFVWGGSYKRYIVGVLPNINLHSWEYFA